jgi:ParB family chromosome partitioning protein
LPSEDHARQEAAYERLSYNRDASTIRRLLTETHVAATDRRTVFVGVEAYTEAGGTILRDLFTEDRGGYFEDVALLDLLVTAKLGREADAVREAEGWKWTEVHLDFPHAHGMRRTYPHPVELSVEDQAALEAARCEVDQLAEWNQTADELPDHVDARFCELEAEIERLEAKRQAYDPDDIARGGAFVILNHDGMVRIERGFIRPEDEKPRPEAEQAGEASVAGETEGGDGQAPQDENGDDESATDEDDDDRPLSDGLVRDLTAHRTLGLRLDLSEQPEVALVAATHALSAQIFYLGADAHVVGIQPIKTDLAAHAEGIEDTAAGKAWADRHASCARQMPRDVTRLWTFVAELDHDSRMALFARCVALTVNAVKLPWERRSRTMTTADQLAVAVSLDMTGYWRPTVRTYLGRITKARILGAVREAIGEEAADQMANMKKQGMAEAAEQLLAGTGWLPPLLRTGRAAQEPAESRQADAVTGPKDIEAYSVAAE